jgi:uncharacterized protein with HEPN domain
MDELTFLNNKLVQDAVIRNFEIIGEASNNIENAFQSLSYRTQSYLFRQHIKCEMS